MLRIAEPGSVVVDERVRRLVSAAIAPHPTGPHGLKGFAAPVPAWVVRSVETESPETSPRPVTPWVGRASELGLLLDRWEQAVDGEGQAVLLCGEPGIGKSRLVQALRTEIGTHRPRVLRTVAEPELLAHHQSEAGDFEAAADSWAQSGRLALQRSAHREAVAFWERGLRDLQRTRPSTRRDERELGLLVALARGLMALDGYASERAREACPRGEQLCDTLGNEQLEFTLLRYRTSCQYMRAEFDVACGLARRCLAMASEGARDTRRHRAELALGQIQLFSGHYEDAKRRFQLALALCAELRSTGKIAGPWQDAEVSIRGLLALIEWFAGRADTALSLVEEGLELAERDGRALSRVEAWTRLASITSLREDASRTFKAASQAVSLAEQFGFEQWLANALGYRGWARSVLEPGPRCLEEVEHARQNWVGQDNRVALPWMLGLNAEVQLNVG